MAQTLVRLAPKELAVWLGLPLDAVEEKVRERAQEGRWRIVASADPLLEDRIELPAVDLNEELDARHAEGREAPRPEPARPTAAPIEENNPRILSLQAELDQARRRNEDLNRLLVQATHAIEEAQIRPPRPTQDNAELEAERGRNAELTEELIEAKRALVTAFDRILDLQQRVFGANENVAAARDDSEAVASIDAILEKLKSRRS